MRAYKILKQMALGSTARVILNGVTYEKKVNEFLQADFRLIHEKIEILKVTDGIITIQLQDSEM
jgi:hypothetical protein